LNPNIPWKTRGNGAISIQVGRGIGKKQKIGKLNEKTLFSYPKKAKDYTSSDCKIIKKIVTNILEKNAKIEDNKTNPGFVITSRKPKKENYTKAVQKIVKIHEIEEVLKELKAEYKGYKNRRGLIGATSGIAWCESQDKSYEIITYRKENKWGTKRFVEDESAIHMDKQSKTTFDNYDYENKHNRLVPSSPCPVLFGIRGDNFEELKKAMSMIISEPIHGWLIFKTNQGTDDHIQRKKISEIQPYNSVLVKGEISQNPKNIRGGHVFFQLKDETGSIDCAAYEPTKEFRRIIRELVVGDIVEVYGGVRKKPLTVNLEKINIKNLVEIIEKTENPICPKCKKHMKSKGKNQGFKCKICGKTSDKATLKKKKRKIKTGLYEVPICARRHLSKPLKRLHHKPF